MPRKFRKKPIVIEAVRVSWQTWNEVCDFVGDFTEGMKGVYCHSDGTYSDKLRDSNTDGCGLLIPTLEGVMLASDGDWIIRGVQGELYPCKPEIFAATYEEVE